MYRLSDYHYHLPESRIAQRPVNKRDESRLLRLDRHTGTISHHRFKEVETLLQKGDLLVVNNTRVVPARLTGIKETGGKVEVLIIDYVSGMTCLEKNGYFQCDCLIRASKSPKKGTALFLEKKIRARVESSRDGIFQVRFFSKGDFGRQLKQHGDIPLPPYIKREGKADGHDAKDYQTVYAQKEGAVAAPTAGLHFTEPLMDRLREKGIEFVAVTLHVGYGTFVPVRVDDIREHQIHSEFFSVSTSSAQKINRARDKGGRIIAVGTTSVRTLEHVSDDSGRVAPKAGMCDLYIYPGYRFKVVNAMITNFHLPESTLLMLISAFAGKKAVFDAYDQAVKGEYRFFSYGDAMLID